MGDEATDRVIDSALDAVISGLQSPHLGGPTLESDIYAMVTVRMFERLAGLRERVMNAFHCDAGVEA